MSKFYLMEMEEKGTPETGEGKWKRRGWSRVEKGTRKSKGPSEAKLHSVRQPDGLKRGSRQGCWAIRRPGLLGLESGCSPACPQVRTDSAVTLPITPILHAHTRVCMPVCLHACVQAHRLAPIWWAILQKPCSTVAAHQNSIKQFRSRSKGCVIITSYW